MNFQDRTKKLRSLIAITVALLVAGCWWYYFTEGEWSFRWSPLIVFIVVSVLAYDGIGCASRRKRGPGYATMASKPNTTDVDRESRGTGQGVSNQSLAMVVKDSFEVLYVGGNSRYERSTRAKIQLLQEQINIAGKGRPPMILSIPYWTIHSTYIVSPDHYEVSNMTVAAALTNAMSRAHANANRILLIAFRDGDTGVLDCVRLSNFARTTPEAFERMVLNERQTYLQRLQALVDADGSSKGANPGM